MAYLNEFPHFNANSMNLDWILEQYSTFNQRLQELHDHFDEAVATMEQEIATYKLQYEQAFAEYKTEVNGTISTFETQVNGAISTFETQVNNSISAFETQVNGQVSTISNAIQQISSNVETYVESHISEWTLEAATISITVRSDDTAEVSEVVQFPASITPNKQPVVMGFDFDDSPIHSGYVFHSTTYHIANNNIYPKITVYRDNGYWWLRVTDRKPSGTGIGDQTYNIAYTVI